MQAPIGRREFPALPRRWRCPLARADCGCGSRVTAAAAPQTAAVAR
jgi:hypothetical protein